MEADPPWLHHRTSINMSRSPPTKKGDPKTAFLEELVPVRGWPAGATAARAATGTTTTAPVAITVAVAFVGSMEAPDIDHSLHRPHKL